MSKETLIVVRRGVKMNKNCVAQKQHGPAGAKDCPYCTFCKHGKCLTMNCDECNKNKLWRNRPISDPEVTKVLDYLRWIGNGPGYLERRSLHKRNFRGDLPLLPLFIEKVRRKLLKKRRS